MSHHKLWAGSNVAKQGFPLLFSYDQTLLESAKKSPLWLTFVSKLISVMHGIRVMEYC